MPFPSDDSTHEHERDVAIASARGRVIERIAARAALFPDLPLDQAPVAGLSERDAALVRAIDAAVTRRWLTLVAVLESRLERTWSRVEPPLQAALLVGAAQLLLFDRVPDHAAVHECVEWTKEHRGPRAAGFVNAVLRKVALLKGEVLPADPSRRFAEDRSLLPLSDGRVLALTEPVFTADAVQRLGQVGSVGRELLFHWIAAHGFASTAELCRHRLIEPPILVAGLPTSAAESAGLTAHETPGWWVFTGSNDELIGLLAAHPTARVQDPASGDPIERVAKLGLAPRLVVDYCAGRGTKTLQLAERFPNAAIIASDPDDRRRSDLAKVAERVANIEVTTPDALPRHFQSADLILLDVPCSNTAVLPRRPEAAYRFDAARLERLVRTQREIVAGAMPLKRPGGAVLYATCSLEPAENSRQAASLRKRHQFTDRGERQRFPAGQPGDPPSRYADGGFWALFG